MYAFAVLLNELITGATPWLGLQMYQVTMAVAVNRQRPQVRDSVSIFISFRRPHTVVCGLLCRLLLVTTSHLHFLDSSWSPGDTMPRHARRCRAF